MENVFLLDPTEPSHLEVFPGAITDVHIDCITNDKTMATFIPPLSREKMIQHYKDKIALVGSGKYSIIMEWVPVNNEGPPLPPNTVIWQGRELAGYVMLNRTPSETGPFRAFVEKLLVSSRHRYRGVARRIMSRLEDEAVKTGSWLLMLDTEIGSGAEHMYPKLGYKTLGIMPKYGISLREKGALADEMFFYKNLNESPRIVVK